VTNDKLAQLLTDLDKRLAVVAVQAQKAVDQASKALAQVNELRDDVARMRKAIISNTDTQEYIPAASARKPGRK
jgi:hypothetical protein